MIKSMENEILVRAKYLNQQKITSIYFGGGTPSILDDIDIKKILSQIDKNYSIARGQFPTTTPYHAPLDIQIEDALRILNEDFM